MSPRHFPAPRLIYVCHSLHHGDRASNLRAISSISRRIAESGDVPIAPQLFLPAILDPEGTGTTDEDLAMRLCLDLVTACDLLLVCGDVVSENMRAEIRRAHVLGIEVMDERDARDTQKKLDVSSRGRGP